MLLGKGEGGKRGGCPHVSMGAHRRTGSASTRCRLPARGHACAWARWPGCCAGCLRGTLCSSQATSAPLLSAWLQEGISDVPGPSRALESGNCCCEWCGLPVSSRAEAPHLHGPTESRGLQGSTGALTVRAALWGAGAVPRLLASPGGKRSAGCCLLQGQLCTARGSPGRNLLLGSPGLSALRRLCVTQPTVRDTAHGPAAQRERQEPSPSVQGKIFLPSHFLC